MREEAFKLNTAGDGARVVDAEREQFGAGEVFEAGRADGEEGKAGKGQTYLCMLHGDGGVDFRSGFFEVEFSAGNHAHKYDGLAFTPILLQEP